MKRTYSIPRVLLAAGAILFGAWSAAQAGEINAKLYGQFGMPGDTTIPGTFVSDLTDHEKFPDDFSIEQPVTSGIQWPDPFEQGDITDNYGVMLEGYLEVPQSGEWQFFVRSDDGSSFQLSSDHDPANRDEIAVVPGDACCDPFLEDGTRNSDPISLNKGEQYYFRFIIKENTGGDWGQVGWTGPGIDEPTVITEEYVQPFVSESASPVITGQPEDLEVPERGRAVFSVNVDALPPVEYQWMKDGEAIDGAINSSLIIENASIEDDGALYSVEVNPSDADAVTSSEATLSVIPDMEPPTLVGARGSAQPQGIIVEFSEPVEESSATTTGNYSFSGQELTVESATLMDEGSVLLEVSEFSTDPLTLEVSGVSDRSSEANTIAAGSTISVSFDPSELLGYWKFDESSGASEAIDSSGNGVTGEVSGASFTSDSERGQVAAFNGDDAYISIGSPAELVDTGVLSVALWFKRDVDHAGEGNDTNHGIDNVLLGHSAGGSNDDYELGSQGSTLEGYMDTAGNDGNWGPVEAGLANGTWHHVATVYDQTASNELKVYLDGEVVGEFGAWGGELDSDEATPWTFGIARIDNQMWGDFEGSLDDAAIWTSALTAAQIQDLAEGAATPDNTVRGLIGPLSFAQQVQSQTVTEGRSVTFSIDPDGTPDEFLSVQWLRDGEPIEGATDTSYTIDRTSLTDDGVTFTAEVSNSNGAFNRIVSEEATLTVEADQESPQVAGIRGIDGSINHVVVEFDELVDPDAAADPDNYSIDGLAIEEAAYDESTRTATLSTTTQTLGTEYTLSISGISDLSEAGNVADTEATFVSEIRYTDEVLVDAPVRFWRLGESEGSTAVSETTGQFDNQDTANGTYGGGFELGVPGLLPASDDTAVRFAGGQIALPDGGDVNVGQGPWLQKSVEMWFKAEAAPAEGETMILYEQGGSTRGIAVYLLGTGSESEATLVFNVWNNADDGGGAPWGSGTGDPDEDLFVEASVPVNQTVHMVGVLDGDDTDDLEGMLRLFVNGELADEATGAGQLYNHSNDIAIANIGGGQVVVHNDAPANPFNGVLDEISLYNAALSEERVAAHFEGAFRGTVEFGPPQITQQPSDTTVVENRNATFSVEFTGTPPWEVTWLQDGSELETIPVSGEGRAELSFTATLDDDGSSITAEVSNEEGSEASDAATLTVDPDTAVPQVAALQAFAGAVNEIRITFDEPVNVATATTFSNYTIEGLEIEEAMLSDDGRTVTLKTSQQTLGQSGSVQIDGVQDMASSPNTLTTETTYESTITYPAEVLAVDPAVYFPLGETSGETVNNESGRAPGYNGTLASISGGALPMLGAERLVLGAPSTAIQFDASELNVIQMLTDSPLVNTGGPHPARTIELWFRADSLPAFPATASSPQKMTLWEEGGATRGVSIYLAGTQDSDDPSEADIYFHAWNVADDGTGSPWGGPGEDTAIFARGTVEVDTIYHAVFVMDGDDTGANEGTITGYLNGEAVAEGPGTGVGQLYSHGDNAGLGAVNQNVVYHDGNLGQDFADPFDGTIDEFSLYNSALSEEQVQAHYDAGLHEVPFEGPGPGPGVELEISSVSLEGGVIRIEWDADQGVLQSADEVTGPYSDVPDASSPYTQPVGEEAQKFYRLRAE